jgi:TrmH family RNA methyltransferase
MQEIISKNNRLIKDIKSLQTKKGRQEKRQFIVEGYKSVYEAVCSDFIIDKVIISEENPETKKIINLLKEKKGFDSNKSLLKVSKDAFEKISDTVSPQGILSIVRQKEKKLTPQKNKLYIILEDMQDPGNLGTIIRTADAGGIGGIILTENCVDLYNPKVIRSTMGSVFHIDVYTGCDLSTTVKKLQENSFRIYAATGNSDYDIWSEKLYGSIAVIIGNESKGISDTTGCLADKGIKIPMPGEAESLNASVAAGIIIYEYIRCRMS